MNKEIMKQTLFIGGLTAVAALFSGGILFVGSNLKLIPNTLTADSLAPYNIINVDMETEHDANAGLPVNTLSFNFEDDEESADDINLEGFSTLKTSIEERIANEPALYNVKGTSKLNNFMFESVSPSDYTDETFTNDYMAFGLLSNDTPGKVDYSSLVDETGTRYVEVTVTNGEVNTGSFVLQREWESLVNSMRLTGTTYTLTLVGEDGLQVTGSFTTEEERNNVLNIDEIVWDSVYKMSQTYRSKYAITSLVLNLSTAGNNQSTIAVTIKEPADRAKFVRDFTEEATKDPDIALPWALTTTITVEEEATPFHVFYPSNREW